MAFLNFIMLHIYSKCQQFNIIAFWVILNNEEQTSFTCLYVHVYEKKNVMFIKYRIVVAKLYKKNQ